MLAKLSRADYYDEDYVLNEYEYKELNFSKVDPYWKVRALCYFFNLDIIGEKHTLIHRVEDTLFNSYLMKKNPEEALKETADLPLEYFLKNTKCPAKRSKGFSIKELEAAIREAALMRPTMCFYNHCLEGETITAVVAFPFTPNMVREMTEVQVFALGKILGLTYSEECGVSPADVFRQKLYDMWYFVEDSSRMHAVVPCQSQLRKCSNLASGLSGNYMCKMCQLELQNREPSLTHDSHDQFFRHKIRTMYEFEESNGFDRKRTIRVIMRRMIKKHDLERMFKDYSVDFSKMVVFYSPQTHRMQYIYLQCATPDEAKRIMQFKSMICAKLGREDIKLESLCNNLVKAHQKYRDPENVCVLVTPPSSMEVVEELPKGDDLVTQITNVVQMVTQLEAHQIILETDINTITGEKDFRHVFVTLPNRQFVERLYEAQPFFGCLICHKLVHPQITPYLRFASDVCLMCPNLRDLNNPMDMCLDCAAKQKTLHISCPSVAPKIQELQLKRKEFAKERGVPIDSLCEKSPNLKLKGDPNNLSKSAYLIQANYIKEPRHERSCYWEQLKDLKPVEMARHMISQVAEMHIKLRNELRNGRYDWFKPIYGSNIEEYMIKANKELQEVVDNGNLMRGHTTKKMLKEGKIFTFQANQPIGFNINPRVNVYENIDQKGVPFVEYSYDRPNPKELWTKNTSNKQRTYSYTDFFNHAKSPNLEIKDNFHLMFMGLDRINLTIKELSQEIYIKIKTLVGEISPTQIMVIDNESIRGRPGTDATDIFNSNVSKPHANLEQNLGKMGRVACVRLANPLDAIAILTKCVKINLPLNNGSTDEPIIVPSKWLRAYIAESSTQTITPNIQTAGYAFSELNKEIEKINTEIKNMMMHNSGGDGFPRRGNNKGGKGGFKGRKGDTSNNDEVRKMGASDRGGPKGFKKNKPQKRRAD